MSAIVEQILASATRLPPFPAVAQKALALLGDPEVSAQRLADVIELDANLTATVLKTVNSAHLSRGNRTDSVRQAVSRLGNGPFRELVFASASAPLLARQLDGYGLSAGDLWKHGLATALLTQILAQAVKHPASPALFTAALMHDLGKVVLGAYVQGEAARIGAEIAAGRTGLEAEQSVLGMDHAELGARIVERWNFSPEMVELIRFHHEPQARPDNIEVALLAVSNQLAQIYGLGSGSDGLAQRAHAGAVERLKLRHQDVELALAEVHMRLQKAEALVALGSEGDH